VSDATVTAAPADPVVPLLFDQQGAWRYCGLSRTGWYRLRSMGKLPAPILIPGVGQRWRRLDLEQWVERLRPSRRGGGRLT
jgi:predicted DNA-binding transcriptional regulator AlpA